MAPALIPLAVAGTAASAGATFMQGQAAAAQAKGQQAMAKYNAALAERQAQAVEQETMVATRLAAEEAHRREGSIRAAVGASGAVSGEGAPLMMLAEQAAQDELAMLMLGRRGTNAAGAARSQKTLYGMQAKLYGQKARSAQIAGAVGAGSTLLTGFSRAGYQGYQAGLWGGR